MYWYKPGPGQIGDRDSCALCARIRRDRCDRGRPHAEARPEGERVGPAAAPPVIEPCRAAVDGGRIQGRADLARGRRGVAAPDERGEPGDMGAGGARAVEPVTGPLQGAEAARAGDQVSVGPADIRLLPDLGHRPADGDRAEGRERFEHRVGEVTRAAATEIAPVAALCPWIQSAATTLFV